MNPLRVELSGSRAVVVAFVLGLALFGAVATAEAQQPADPGEGTPSCGTVAQDPEDCHNRPFFHGDASCDGPEGQPRRGPAENGPEGNDNWQLHGGPLFNAAPEDCGDVYWGNPCAGEDVEGGGAETCDDPRGREEPAGQ